jgi:hypothetical protein
MSSGKEISHRTFKYFCYGIGLAGIGMSYGLFTVPASVLKENLYGAHDIGMVAGILFIMAALAWFGLVVSYFLHAPWWRKKRTATMGGFLVLASVPMDLIFAYLYYFQAIFLYWILFDGLVMIAAGLRVPKDFLFIPPSP